MKHTFNDDENKDKGEEVKPPYKQYNREGDNTDENNESAPKKDWNNRESGNYPYNNRSGYNRPYNRNNNYNREGGDGGYNKGYFNQSGDDNNKDINNDKPYYKRNEGGGYNSSSSYNSGGYNKPYNNRYNQGGYNQGGGYNRPYNRNNDNNQGGGGYFKTPNPESDEKVDNPIEKKSYGDNQGGGYNSGGYNKPYNRDNNQGGGYNSGGYNKPYNRDNNQGGGYNSGGYNKPYNRDNNQGGGYNSGGYNKPYNRDNNQGGGYNSGGYNKPYNRDNNQGGGYNGGGYNKPYNRDNNQGGGYNQGGYNRPYNRDNNQGGGYNQGGYNRPYNRDNNQGGGYNQGGYNRPYNRDNNQGGGYNNRGGNNRFGGGGFNRNGGNNRFQQNRNFNQKQYIIQYEEEELGELPPLPEVTELRLNKYIAQCGVCGRRDADELIRQGLVKVNGEVITQMGYKINPKTDDITYNGKSITLQKKIYILYNKPKNMATYEDEKGKRTVLDDIEDRTRERVYPVGRLDRDTTGLIILTNDGDLTEKLTHPSNNIKKYYHVTLENEVSEEDFIKLKAGIELEDGLAHVEKIEYIAGKPNNEVLLEIHIGRNRIVRRLFEALNNRVRSLDRVKIAHLTKKGLPRGNWRMLDEKEIGFLKML